MDNNFLEELEEEEEIVSSSTRYLNRSLNLYNLTYLQALELKKLISFLSRLKTFVVVLLKNALNGKGFFSDFEKIVLQTEPNDCSLIAKYSTIEKFDNVLLNVTNIPHPLRVHLDRSLIVNELKRHDVSQKINTTPLIVMIHGLGGQSSQFEQLIAIMSQCADIFTLDLPGFGNSAARENVGISLTSPDSTDKSSMIRSIASLSDENYETDRLCDKLTNIISLKLNGRKVILIGHSMGTHLCVKILDRLPLNTVESLILMSPPKVESELSKKKLGVLSRFPIIFDILRIWDRIGGLASKSVQRQVFGDNSFKGLRQLRWNLDVDSRIILKYIKGFTSCTEVELTSAVAKIHNIDKGNRVLILCGENDVITPKKSSISIAQLISKYNPSLEILDQCGHSILLNKPEMVSGLVYRFIESLSELNINLAWCLQIKAVINGDKWGLKNETKWKKLTPLSDRIVNPTTGEVSSLLSMKTLRESDPVHNPVSFEKRNPGIVSIIDISSDLPSYNPKNFSRIKYLKMPTVSKITPDSANIREFIMTVDEILLGDENGLVAVHCHYGFNRTGFLICCYLIEKLGWDIDDAILAFKQAREPGIKHPHFIDGIYVRYK